MSKQEVNLKTIKDVFFYYSSLYTPVLTKDAKDKGKKIDPDSPSENAEYVVKIAMSEEVYRAMKKNEDMKGAKNFPNAKEYTVAEFEKIFHEEGGMPEFGDDVEDIVIVKFAQKAWNVNKKSEMRAPNLIGIKDKVKDHNGLDINKDTLIGNGSKGHLQVRPHDFGEYGLYLYPHAVCITELVPYEGSGGTETDYDAFGMEEADEVEDTQDEVPNDDFDDDIPFQ